ncbi:TPA: hypothetical protein JLR89_005720, partial [Escherichia coli]|nr:hypothetical protein [Escherichia coli]
KETFINVTADCSSPNSTTGEIEALKYMIAVMFSVLDQNEKNAIIYQLTEHADNPYIKSNIEMLLPMKDIGKPTETKG